MDVTRGVKINSLELENVKRVRAVSFEPKASGLTIIGGGNGQGKTSVLDAISWALGGEKYRPSSPKRDSSIVPPHLRVELSNGLIVERKGASSTLTVTDSTGKRSGQRLLDEFISTLALDLPKFMQASARDKADILLKIIGVGDKLAELEREEKEKYTQRTTIGRIAEQKKAYADGLPQYVGVPEEPLSAMELIRQQQDILARNGENQRLRDKALSLHAERNRLAEKVNSLREELEQYTKQLTQVDLDMTTAYKTSEQLKDESTKELERSIADIDDTNRKVRANLDREHANEDAEEYARRYNVISTEIDQIRKSRTALLDNAKLPLPELSVSDGELVYRGQKWDCLSGSEQLRVSAAIARAYKPDCGFILMDKLEQLDGDTLNEFGAWAEENGYQIIATRVGSGDECSIVIEDGYATQPAVDEPPKKWKVGEF